MILLDKRFGSKEFMIIKNAKEIENISNEFDICFLGNSGNTEKYINELFEINKKGVEFSVVVNFYSEIHKIVNILLICANLNIKYFILHMNNSFEIIHFCPSDDTNSAIHIDSAFKLQKVINYYLLDLKLLCIGDICNTSNYISNKGPMDSIGIDGVVSPDLFKFN